MRPRGIRLVVAMGGVLLVFALFAATAAARPIIGPITGTANTSWQNVGGPAAVQNINATVGFWTGGFGFEPGGDDVLTVPVVVNGNGGITFNYQIQTNDLVQFDNLNIYLDTPTGTVTLVSNYNPNPVYGTVFLSPVNTVVVDTKAWKGQTVTLRIVAHQDGFGDQFQALITNLSTVSNPGV